VAAVAALVSVLACLPASAQSPAPTRIGVLRLGAPTDPADRAHLAALDAGLREGGYVPGQNVRLEVRYAQGRVDRLPALARQLLALQVTAIVTSNPYTTRAAREVTSTLPIVVALDYETDPVAMRWIAGLPRPGGNLTGIFLDQPEMSGKLLQLLKETVPSLTRVAVLWDETLARAQLDATEAAARATGLVLVPFGVKSADDLEGAFAAAVRERAEGLVVLTSPLLSLNRARISELSLSRRLPGIALFTNFPGVGFLMAYGPDQPDAFRRAGSQYVAPILRGARPGDLPVQRPEKFELVINMRTARALGLTIPAAVSARADRVVR
jgi:ABC-type uncharacterized transport system substrate-binding protein